MAFFAPTKRKHEVVLKNVIKYEALFSPSLTQVADNRAPPLVVVSPTIREIDL